MLGSYHRSACPPCQQGAACSLAASQHRDACLRENVSLTESFVWICNFGGREAGLVEAGSWVAQALEQPGSGSKVLSCLAVADVYSWWLSTLMADPPGDTVEGSTTAVTQAFRSYTYPAAPLNWTAHDTPFRCPLLAAAVGCVPQSL